MPLLKMLLTLFLLSLLLLLVHVIYNYMLRYHRSLILSTSWMLPIWNCAHGGVYNDEWAQRKKKGKSLGSTEED